MMAAEQLLSVSPAQGVLAGASTDDDGIIEAQMYSWPNDGGVSMDSDGSFGFSSNTSYVGAVTFQFVGVVGGMFGDDTSAPATVTIDQISLPNPGPQSTYDGATVTLPLPMTDSAGGSVTYSASNLPPGLSPKTSVSAKVFASRARPKPGRTFHGQPVRAAM